MLEQRGMTQTYIDKIKPIALLMSAYQVEKSSGSCSNPGACDNRPRHKFEMDDSTGTVTLNSGQLKWKANEQTSESIMGFANPMPTGDFTIRMSISQIAGSVYADAYAALPDLRIGINSNFYN